jgi:hypothetical protein
MQASRTQDATAGVLGAAAGKMITSRLVDASLILLLLAPPFLAPHGGADALVVLAAVTFAGALAIYQKGSRAQRLVRCSWVVFVALGTAIWLGTRAADPTTQAHAVARFVAESTQWVVGAGFAGWGVNLARLRRGPRLQDAYDGAALFTVVILGIAAAAFTLFGNARSVGALVMPAEVVGVHFLVREQCSSLQKARLFAQIAGVGAGLALVGWVIAR